MGLSDYAGGFVELKFHALIVMTFEMLDTTKKYFRRKYKPITERVFVLLILRKINSLYTL